METLYSHFSFLSQKIKQGQFQYIETLVFMFVCVCVVLDIVDGGAKYRVYYHFCEVLTESEHISAIFIKVCISHVKLGLTVC